MSKVQGIKPVFGTSSIGDPKSLWGKSDENILEAFSILKKHGVNKLDSAQAYHGSEQKLGALKARTEHGFAIDTKWPGESLEKLQVKWVDIFYIHSPDFKTPLEDTLAGVNEAYKSGIFQRFGLSNYPPQEVQKVYDVCKANGYILPTVYQENHSAIARKQEEILFPVLRKLGISFYAYSPIAGGFLTKSKQQIEAGGTRFSKDQMYGIYHSLCVKNGYMEAPGE
ncbi:MAG: hypothetical protein M1834_004898 [Cirrosporium novae-zelandiae]|nr:MAG: hypothetical protein M1834_004898 [Cirrosporium novae-zelandiae]